MAVTLDNICKNISHGNIYIGAYVPPDLHSVGEILDSSGVPSGGTDVGATQGEAVFSYSATIETIDIEQVTFGVCPHVTAEEATISFTAAEPTADNIKRAIGQGFLRDFSGGGKTGKVISVGGLTDVTGDSITVVGKKKDGSGYVGAMVYHAYNDAGLERRFKKGEATMIAMTFRGLATEDLTERSEGDQLAQWFEQE